MPHSEILEERLRLLNIDHDVIAELPAARQILAPAIDKMLDNFYAYIRGEPELLALFADDSAITRARAAQKNHWLTLFDGDYDRDFFEKSVRIGNAHARIGLTLDWYMAGYYQMFDQFIDLILEHYAARGELATRVIQAVSKVIFLDMDLVIHCYLDNKDSDMRHILGRATDFRAEMWKFSDDLNALAAQLKATIEALSDEAKGPAGGRQVDAAGQLAAVASGSHIDKLSTQIDQLARQTGQLDERLGELPLSDKLYLDHDTSKSGTFARVIALVTGKALH